MIPSSSGCVTGLTEMLVTDLSRSPELEVLGTDWFYQILDDMDRLHCGPLTADSVQELPRRAAVNAVLRGSFAKAGESIRLSARLQDARTGKVILSEKTEGTGRKAFFDWSTSSAAASKPTTRWPPSKEDLSGSSRRDDGVGRSVPPLRRGDSPPRTLSRGGGTTSLSKGGRAGPRVCHGTREARRRARKPRNDLEKQTQRREGAKD